MGWDMSTVCKLNTWLKMWGKQTCFSKLRWFMENGQWRNRLDRNGEMINPVKMQGRASPSGPQWGFFPLNKTHNVCLNRFVMIFK